MKPDDHRFLLRALDADLSEAERVRLNRLLDDVPEARAEWQAYRSLRTAVAASAAESFSPYFADRVMRRIAHERSVRRAAHSRSWPTAFSSPFRLAGAGLALALVAVLCWATLYPQAVRVPYGETATVELPDGSRVELSSGSTLSYRRLFGWLDRRVHLEGEAYFAVKRSDKPFVVATFSARVVVKGTRFNVRAWPEERLRGTTVALESGSVEVAPAARPEASVLLSPGEMTTVAADTAAPARPAPASLPHVLAWRSGGLYFSDEPLAFVLKALERRYAVEILLRDARLGQRSVAYLAPTPLTAEAVLADICTSLGVRFRRTANGFEVLSP